MKFTYKIYDLDGSGYLEPNELVSQRPLRHLTQYALYLMFLPSAACCLIECTHRPNAWQTPTVNGETEEQWLE